MKVALVTGAYKGLGLAWCQKLVQEGYEVILTARNLEQAEKAVMNFSEQDQLHVYPKALDVVNETQLADLAAWIETQFGKIDLIINNAGINPKDYTDKSKMAKAFHLKDLDAEELFQVFKINSIAPLLIVKHLRSNLLKSEQPKVISISSWLGSVSNLSFGGHYGYVGSKNLLNVLNKSMANELKAEGIIAVTVNPGWVQTDMGGQKAQFTPEQAVSNLFQNVLSKITIEDSGRFINFDGVDHPW